MSWKPVLATETLRVQKVYFPHGLLVWLYGHQISIISSAITLAIIMVHLEQGGLSFRTIENAWQRSQGEGRKALKRLTSKGFNSTFTFRAGWAILASVPVGKFSPNSVLTSISDLNQSSKSLKCSQGMNFKDSWHCFARIPTQPQFPFLLCIKGGNTAVLYFPLQLPCLNSVLVAELKSSTNFPQKAECDDIFMLKEYCHSLSSKAYPEYLPT